MPDDSKEISNLNADTADKVLQDIQTRLEPWLTLLTTLQQYGNAVKQLGLDSDSSIAAGQVHIKNLARHITKYVNAGCAVINSRLEENAYDPWRGKP